MSIVIRVTSRISERREKPIDRIIKVLLILSGHMVSYNQENFENYLDQPETLFLNFSEKELEEIQRDIPVS